jgi:hypothetical protein
MQLDKKRQKNILLSINDLLKERNASCSAYLFGGSSLISQDVISRTTKDIDLFLLFVGALEELVHLIKEKSAKQFKIKVDIGVNGRFDIKVKGFTWVLPKGAYERAVHQFKFSNLNVFALHPLDIVSLKCDRLSKQDLEDIETIFISLKPPREQVISIFEEYSNLLEGNLLLLIT